MGLGALLRGKISYYADSPTLYKTKIAPEVEAGRLIPLFYDPGFDGKNFSVPGSMKGHAILPFHELYKSIKGAVPNGKLWEAYKSLLLVNSTMYRIMALPPGSPREAVDALRAAVARLAADKTYVAEAIKLTGDVPPYVTGANLNDDVRAGLSSNPEFKAFMDAYTKQTK